VPLTFLVGSGRLTWLQWHFRADTFSSKAGGGGAGGGGRGGGAGSDDAAQGGWFRIFSVAAYKPYFDVDTSDVVERIWESVFPFRGTFTEKTSENPDLYVSIAS